METGGGNLGMNGMIINREKLLGVVHVKDANNNSFPTQLSNNFIIVNSNKSWISPPPKRN
ncbi:rCG39442, partial [Rattus norvegicus]